MTAAEKSDSKMIHTLSGSRSAPSSRRRRIVRAARRAALAALLALGAPLLQPEANAITSYWHSNGNGSWNTTTLWSSTAPPTITTPAPAPNAEGDVADFSKINITAARTVTLDGSKTVGSVLFGDTDNNQNWTLNAGSGGSLILDELAGTPTIDVNNNTRTATINTQVSGSEGLAKTGAGTLILANSNNYTGATTVSAGTLQLGNGGTTGALNTASALVFAANTNFQINQTDAVTQGVDFSGAAFTGNVNLIKAGTGNLVLTGNNTVRELRVNSATGFIDIGPGNLFVNNGGGNTISSTTGGTINGTGTITLGTGGGTNFGDNSSNSGTLLTINPRVTGANGFEYCCAAGGTIFLANNANDFAGPVFINSAGTLRVSTINNGGVASGLGLGSQINLNTNNANLEYVGLGESTNRTINIGNNFSTLITQSGASGNLLFNGAFTGGTGTKTLTLRGSTAGTGEIFSNIGNGSSGTQAITKSGTGTWTLSGGNTYSGVTTINQGELIVANNAALGTTAGGTAIGLAGRLSLQGGINTGTEAITLSNSLPNAITNLSGNNVIGGSVTQIEDLATTTGIQSVAGQLTLNGNINLFRSTLAISGDGDVVINGMVTGAPGGTVNGINERYYDTLGAHTNNIRGVSGGLIGNVIALSPQVERLLTTHLNYANDAAVDARISFLFDTTDYGALYRTAFTPDESGAWIIRSNTNIDDNTGFWLDLNQNSTFEASERFAERACCGQLVGTTPALVAGQTYTLALAMNDTGGGGSFTDIEFSRPSAPATFINLDPSLPANNGLFTQNVVSTNAIVKTGEGTLTLNSAVTANGTTINNGTLILNNTLTSDVQVNGDATLKGAGTINGDLAIGPNALHSPGLSPAQQIIAGDYLLDGMFQWEIQSPGLTPGTDFDFLNIGGTATLNGTIKLVSLGGFIVPLNQPITLLTAADILLDPDFEVDLSMLLVERGGPFVEIVPGGNGEILRVTFSIPEPTSMSLLALATGALWRRSRRPRRVCHLIN